MRKFCCAIAVIVLCGAVLCSCQLQEVRQTNETLEICSTSSTDFRFQAALKQYQELYPDVTVQITSESNPDIESSQAYYTKLASEIMGGKGPDLFVVNDSFWNVEKMMRQDIFADMQPYFDADAFDWEPYNTAVMEAGVWEGKRYVIPLTYSIPVLITTQKAIDETGFDVGNCGDFYGFMEETQKIMDDPNQTRAVFRQSWTMKWFPQIAGISYIDYDNLLIDPTAPGLAEGLAWCRDNFAEDLGDYNLYDLYAAASIWDGHALFEYPFSYGLKNGFMLNYAVLDTVDTGVMVPIRNLEGGINARVLDAVAVRANSPNLQNAYNFLKILLSPSLHTECVGNQTDLSVLNEANWDYYRRHAEGYDFIQSYHEDFTSVDTIPESAMAEYMGYTEEVDGAYFLDRSGFISAMFPYLYEGAPYEETLTEAVAEVEKNLSE